MTDLLQAIESKLAALDLNGNPLGRYSHSKSANSPRATGRPNDKFQHVPDDEEDTAVPFSDQQAFIQQTAVLRGNGLTRTDVFRMLKHIELIDTEVTNKVLHVMALRLKMFGLLIDYDWLRTACSFKS